MNRKYALIAIISLLLIAPVLAQPPATPKTPRRAIKLLKHLVLGRIEVRGKVVEVTDKAIKLTVDNITLSLSAEGYWLCLTPKGYSAGKWAEISKVVKAGDVVGIKALIIRAKRGMALIWLRGRNYALIRLPPPEVAWRALGRGTFIKALAPLRPLGRK